MRRRRREGRAIAVVSGASRWSVEVGDCLDRLRQLPDNSIDSIVTDPPAGIGMMNKGWDHHRGGRDAWVAWLAGIMRECLRVLKPGGYAHVWAIPRTSHWTAWALDDAGFMIDEITHHAHAKGFPKSITLSNGHRTAQKPAVEHWILAHKPREGTYEQNLAKWGTGFLRVDDCRVPRGAIKLNRELGKSTESASGWKSSNRSPVAGTPNGKGGWPANFVISHASGAWYTLRDDVSLETKEAVYRYFGAFEAVCAVRQGDSRKAFGRSSSLLLQPGVLLFNTPCCAQEGMDIASLPAVSPKFRSDSGMGSEWPPQILFTRMSRQVLGEADESKGCSERGQRVLENLRDTQTAGVRAREAFSVEGRPISNQSRIRSRDGRSSSSTSYNAGATDGGASLHSRAQNSNGCKNEASSSEGRDSSSQERREGRQSVEESRAPLSKRALDRTSSGGTRTQRGSYDDSPSSAADPRLEVADFLIPEDWFVYFDESHRSDLCVQVGTIKVRGHGCENSQAGPTYHKGKRPGGFYSTGSANGSSKPNGVLYGDQEMPLCACVPGCPVRALDEQGGYRRSGTYSKEYTSPTTSQTFGKWKNGRSQSGIVGDSGFVSRYFNVFYATKPARREKEAGLEGFPTWSAGAATEREDGTAGLKNARAGAGRTGGARNVHATVKGIELCRHLCRMITPIGGVVLDPFAGSGSIGCAAVLEGLRYVGFELDDEGKGFVAIARARIRHWEEQA